MSAVTLFLLSAFPYEQRRFFPRRHDTPFGHFLIALSNYVSYAHLLVFGVT